MPDRCRLGRPAPWFAVLLLAACLPLGPQGPSNDDFPFYSPYLSPS